MCRFCIEHGEGKKWYLQASSYAADLNSDLKRRGYVIGFLKHFDRNREAVQFPKGETQVATTNQKGHRAIVVEMVISADGSLRSSDILL